MRSENQLDILGSPLFNSLAALVHDQLVCLLPVVILMFSSFVEFCLGVVVGLQHPMLAAIINLLIK